MICCIKSNVAKYIQFSFFSKEQSKMTLIIYIYIYFSNQDQKHVHLFLYVIELFCCPKHISWPICCTEMFLQYHKLGHCNLFGVNFKYSYGWWMGQGTGFERKKKGSNTEDDASKVNSSQSQDFAEPIITWLVSQCFTGSRQQLLKQLQHIKKNKEETSGESIQREILPP